MHYTLRKSSQTVALAHCVGRWFCAIGLLMLLGCGHGGRMPLEGTITVDGRPLEKGYIQFTPLAGTLGPTAGAEIINGEFTVSPQGGPFAGKFQVQITAAGRTGRRVRHPLSGTMIDENAQILPARYNTKSQLQAEVTADGPNRFEFAISSN